MALMKIRDQIDIENLQTSNPKRFSSFRKVQNCRLDQNIGSLSKQLGKALTKINGESYKLRMKANELKSEQRISRSVLPQEVREKFVNEDKRKLLAFRPKTASALFDSERRRHSMPADFTTDIVNFRTNSAKQLRRGSLSTEALFVPSGSSVYSGATEEGKISFNHYGKQSTTAGLSKPLYLSTRRGSMPVTKYNEAIKTYPLPKLRPRSSSYIEQDSNMVPTEEQKKNLLKIYRMHMKQNNKTIPAVQEVNKATKLAIKSDGKLAFADEQSVNVKCKLNFPKEVEDMKEDNLRIERDIIEENPNIPEKPIAINGWTSTQPEEEDAKKESQDSWADLRGCRYLRGNDLDENELTIDQIFSKV